MYRPKLSAPIWRGEDLRGKTILLYPEQGRGDAIQFVRSAAVLQGRGARVILECAREMVPLFSSAPGVDRLLAQGIAVSEPIDYQASLLEVVDVCYCQTGQIPYAEELFASGAGYLTVSEALIDYWCRWLGTSPSGRRVGINWQGNPGHHADVYRSVPLEVLRPLLEVGGIDWVNLQFGFGVEQLERCDFADSILRLPDHVDTTDGAFTDTAAIVKNLDLVITTDTAVAHLAAAVGTKVMMLLGKVPDWRWLMEGETTPWYPTITMLRQSQLGHWDDVVHQAVTRLTAGLENQ